MIVVIKNYRHIVIGPTEGIPGQFKLLFKIVGHAESFGFRKVRCCFLILEIDVDGIILPVLECSFFKDVIGIIRMQAWPFAAAGSPKVIV